MTSRQDVQQFIGCTALDSEGSKVGKIGKVYMDETTGMPLWVTVATGMFGTKQSFAPLYGAKVSGGEVTLAVSKEQLRVGTETVEAGRARPRKYVVTDDAAVNETVRKEQIEEPGVEGNLRDAGR